MMAVSFGPDGFWWVTVQVPGAPLAEGATAPPEYRVFDAAVAAITPYPITRYQPTYFVAESFAKLKHQALPPAPTHTLCAMYDALHIPNAPSLLAPNTSWPRAKLRHQDPHLCCTTVLTEQQFCCTGQVPLGTSIG